MTTNALSIIESGTINFDAKSGVTNITIEAALFKGGAAGRAVKDAAGELALRKAASGNYRAAAEMLKVAFPAVAKAYDATFGGELPWANKDAFKSYLRAMLNAKQGKNGWTKKQDEARVLLGALLQLPAFRVEVQAGIVVGEVEAAEAVEG